MSRIRRHKTREILSKAPEADKVQTQEITKRFSEPEVRRERERKNKKSSSNDLEAANISHRLVTR